MPDQFEAAVRDATGVNLRERAVNYAAGQHEDQSRLQAANWHKGERGMARAYASALLGFRDPLNEALANAGIAPEEFFDADAESLTTFCKAVPMMYVDSQLERVQNASGRHWAPNDLNDIDAMMRALVYCDIVVGEKYWINVARQAKLGERFNTVLLTSLNDLPVHMVV
jgi:hypothetical protein